MYRGICGQLYFDPCFELYSGVDIQCDLQYFLAAQSFDLIKNGIVEATYSDETYHDLGARGSWTLHSALTPPGCYEMVVSATINDEYLEEREQIKVRDFTGMSNETIRELTECDAD